MRNNIWLPRNGIKYIERTKIRTNQPQIMRRNEHLKCNDYSSWLHIISLPNMSNSQRLES